MRPLDDIDRRIIALLQADGRQSNRALAEAVGIAPSTCHERVRELTRRGVITGYHAAVDLGALNRNIEAIVSVRLRPKTRPVLDEFLSQVWALEETMEVYLLSGTDDIIVHLSVVDTTALRSLVLDSITAIPGVVDETTSLVFSHTRKRVLGFLADSPGRNRPDP